MKQGYLSQKLSQKLPQKLMRLLQQLISQFNNPQLKSPKLRQLQCQVQHQDLVQVDHDQATIHLLLRRVNRAQATIRFHPALQDRVLVVA